MANQFGKIIFKTIGLLSLAGYQIHQIKGLLSRTHELWYPELPQRLDGYRIVHISDLHGAVFGKDNDKLAQRIMALEPDILCITGDMVHSYSDDGEAFFRLVAGLDHRLVKLFVSGNHENAQRTLRGYQPLNRSVLYRKLENFGMIHLDQAVYQVADLPLQFAGMADRHEAYSGSAAEASFDPGASLAMPDQARFNVALIHRPNYFRRIADYGYDLMLSGHTHGGIIRILGKGGLLSPDRRFFPELDKGLFRSGQAILHVSSGLGLVKPIPKFGNRPEVTLLILRHGQGQGEPIRPVKDR